MFYVQRDANGSLTRVEAAPFTGMQEEASPDAEDIQEWFSNRAIEDSLRQLEQTDSDMIRVLEDLIHVLMTKGVLRITDLPAAAQHKLVNRSHSRDALGGLSRLINDDESNLI